MAKLGMSPTAEGMEKSEKNASETPKRWDAKWTLEFEPKDTVDMSTDLDRFKDGSLYMARQDLTNTDTPWSFVRVKHIEPAIPVEVWLTERQYRVLQLQAVKNKKRPDEQAREMIAQPLDQMYGDGLTRY